jgi:hypothetical protein
MAASFTPISKERAEQIREALRRARSDKDGVVIDRKTGQFAGVAPLNKAPQDKVNMIGKFDTHFWTKSKDEG